MGSFFEQIMLEQCGEKSWWCTLVFCGFHYVVVKSHHVESQVAN